ncbi:MAG: response regulator [Candidatus Omnitrophota bacterium]|jgi:two-component system response regulator (stage 0 sporulation protein F)|nr:MAG: response regulator [Candidatus Omnitrophota bacterium]
MAETRKILVVDDEKEINETLSEVLTNRGHQMFSAFDGDEAIKIIKENNIDLVLLDMRMPKVDGIEVIKAIKQHSPKTRIMVITGYADTFLQRAKELGVDGFFVKPVRLDAIIKRMRELLEVKRPPSWSWRAKAEEIGGHVIKARILFIEDSKPSLPLVPLDDLIQTGKAQLETRFIYTQEEARENIKEFKPDIVILAMVVPLKKTDELGSGTFDLSDEILELQGKGIVKALIVHSRRDVLEQEHKDKLDQLYEEMKDVPEMQLDDFSPQGRRRHIEKLKARIIETCIENKLFAK